MMFCMTDSIRLDTERVTSKRKSIFGSQPKLIEAWKKRFGSAPHQTQISKVELGTKGMSIERVGQLAELLETNVDYLIGRSDDDKPVSDLEDQVVFSVQTELERKLLDTIGREFLQLAEVDQQTVLELVKRLPKKPRIIGDE